MLIKAADIAKLYLFTTFRERSVFIFSFLMPLLFTFLIGQSLAGDAGGPTRWSMAVANEDRGELGRHLVARLETNPSLALQRASAEAVVSAVVNGDSVVALRIPPEFSTALLGERSVTLELHAQAEDARVAQLVEQAVLEAAVQLEGSLQAAQVSAQVADRLRLFEASDGASAPRAYFDDAFRRAQEMWEEEPPLTVHVEIATRLRTPENTVPSGIDQSSPGMMVMFTMFFMVGGGTVLILEREQGTLRRLVVMPISKFSILFGKLAGIYLGGIIQMAVLILTGALLFKVRWGQSPAALVLLVASFAFAVTSLGVLMAALARTSAQANALSTVVVMAFSALGGAWWPLEIVPEWMRQFGHLFPTAWAMDGFNDIITRGLGVEEILLEFVTLLGFGGLYLVVGIWRFRYE